MKILDEFSQLKRDIEALFSSKEMIEKQIYEKALKIYKLNSECISLSNDGEHEKNNFKELCLEISNYVSNILHVRLNNDGLIKLKEGKLSNNNIAETQQNRVVQCRISNTEDDLCENKNSFMHANSYAFKNIYKLDDFMNTTNWLWNKELKSKIVEVASNKGNGFPNVVKPPQIGGDFSSITPSHNKLQCNALPRLVCRTVKVEESSLKQIKYINPLKSYIEKAFKLES